MAPKSQEGIRSAPGGKSSHYSEDYDTISLKDLILTLWGYRRAIVVLSLAATIVIIAIAALIYLLQEKERVAKLQFKLDFEGADRNQYPNGMKFSTSDILSIPVLNKVYKEDKLHQYLEFPDFKASLAVIQRNDELKLLEYEYATRLSDQKLNVDQRKRLEAEFLEKKKNALIPVYTLMWDQPMASIPRDQVAKVLNHILRAWGEYADRVKGANQYQISLVSPNVLSKEDIEGEDYYIALDMLRLTTKRIHNDINKLEKIPGAKTLKTGKNRISLGDLRYRTQDCENFKLSPLGGLIWQAGATKNQDFAIGYLQNRIFELKLQNEEAVATVNVYEDSLSQYTQKAVDIVPRADSATPLTPLLRPGAEGNVPAMTPQFGASFLTSLIEMAQENVDARFRQDITEKVISVGLKRVNIDGELEYYEHLCKQIMQPHSGTLSRAFIDSAEHRIRGTMAAVLDRLIRTIDDMNNIYLELSKMNLNPDSTFYNVTQPPIMTTERPLRPKKLMAYAILAWILAEGAIIFAILIANIYARPRD